MGTTTAGIWFALSILIALVVIHRPLGDYMFRIFTGTKHLAVERGIYRLVGVNPEADQSWGIYARSVLAFSALSLLFLYGILRLQGLLPLDLGFPGMAPDLAFNTAASFTTNTNWQSYVGEATLGYLAQMIGLAVQNFVSAAVGIAVALAVIRGFARKQTDQLGNFWVDLVRASIRLLLPLAFLIAIVLTAGGAIQNFHNVRTHGTVAGAEQSITGGPVASQEAIKELGTNGGGFYNVNSAHPFENPTAWTNWVEIFALLMIASALPRTFGRMVGDKRQGYAIIAIMAVLAIGSTVVLQSFQGIHHGTVPVAVGAATEGTENRFGVENSAVFGGAATLTSTGAVDSAHDSYTSLGGAVLMFNMMLGEVAPGGVGAGLYGILVLAIITVFIAGLMVGRTPEYLGKKIGSREVKFASMYFLTTPAIVLIGTGIAMAFPAERAAMLNPGAHGLSEVLYAFTSAGNNNGSAFAGLSANTTWYNTALGLAMLFGRFLPILFVLGLAGSLARQTPAPESAATLPTHRPLFVGLVIGVTLTVVALTFFPALALGPLAEGIH